MIAIVCLQLLYSGILDSSILEICRPEQREALSGTQLRGAPDLNAKLRFRRLILLLLNPSSFHSLFHYPYIPL